LTAHASQRDIARLPENPAHDNMAQLVDHDRNEHARDPYQYEDQDESVINLVLRQRPRHEQGPERVHEKERRLNAEVDAEQVPAKHEYLGTDCRFRGSSFSNLQSAI
jgi:hypothetical protein